MRPQARFEKPAAHRTLQLAGGLLAGLLWLAGCAWSPAAAAQEKAASPAPPATPRQANTCLDCHSSLDKPLGIDKDRYASDVHAQHGLTCASCHGGDPTKDDQDAMSKAAGFKGKPDRKQIPELCGSCHANAAYIHQFNPSLRTDQLAQYKTSVHGQRLAQGDTKVAVCTDCHSVHGILPASDSRSSVHPLNIANTCARCHADAAYMKDYKIPTDQFAGYSASVHYAAMVERGDLSAPTCSTCHGNHGAAPPGVGSVENVCSTCHVFQAQLFDQSPHKAAFAAASLPSCVTCHSNHRISHPSDAYLGTGPQSICSNCHSPGDAGLAAAVVMQQDLGKLEMAIARSDEVLDRAESSGMEVSQAKMDQAQARDALTKARVTVHTFRPARVQADIQPGLQIAAKDLQAGEQALKERDYRRLGLGVSLLAIVLAMTGLRLYIRQIESGERSPRS
ncbi:MAG TPA: cytochrome c3 family protein [Terriglobales bacterium]|nr:cytochrome c3 family protein [Terriglobales bacterium]